jgi:hypothetical protein
MITNELKQKISQKLLLQYGIYLDLLDEIKKQKVNLIKTENLTEVTKIDGVIKNLGLMLQKTSDEMTFPLPSLWMTYKFDAYKNTDKEICRIRDFVDHCSPSGYICTKRLSFLRNYLDIAEFNPNDCLTKIINSQGLLELEKNNEFINNWLKNEFKVFDSKISKWE